MNTRRITVPSFPNFNSIFDNVLLNVGKSHYNTYPPSNLIKNDENTFTLQFAVAGFAREDIEVSLKNRKLFVKGSTKEDTKTYLHRNIAARSFNLEYNLEKNVEIKEAVLKDGLLEIVLIRTVPLENEPVKIDIK